MKSDDRIVKEVPCPPHRPLDPNILYSSGKQAFTKDQVKPNWRALKDHLHKEGRLSRESCHRLLTDTLNIFSKGINLQKRNLICKRSKTQ
jgi:serine/threonine-protein phosphatase 2B catalytic subunit